MICASWFRWQSRHSESWVADLAKLAKSNLGFGFTTSSDFTVKKSYIYIKKDEIEYFFFLRKCKIDASIN